MCEDLWSTSDAQVACRQLGYSTQGMCRVQYTYSLLYCVLACSNNICQLQAYTTGVIFYSSAHFGQGTGPILLDNLGCSGSESRLVECSYDSHTADCSHSEDAGVRCQGCKCPIYLKFFLSLRGVQFLHKNCT